MFNGGWDYAKLYRLHNLLVEPHQVEINIQLLNQDHTFLKDLSGVFMDGNVTMDTTGDVSRSANLTLVDPYHQLGLDPADPGTAVFMTRMFQITYRVGELDGSYWYEIPLFCGPINKVDRNGIFLDIECLGKESLSSAGIWDGMTLPKGTKKVYAIQTVMNLLGGENIFRMRIVNSGAVLRDDLNIKRGGDRSAWNQTKKLAASMGCQAFYDGQGILNILPWNQSVCFIFSEAYLTSPVQVSYNLDDLVNAVQVTGGIPKGAKTEVVGRAVAPAWHPFSPQQLARSGIPLYLPLFDDDDDLTTKEDAIDKANVMLTNQLQGAMTMATNSVVVPHLEEGDLISYSTPFFYGVNRLNKFTIPLTGAATMALGYDDKFNRGKLAQRRKKIGWHVVPHGNAYHVVERKVP